jgi:hypothetical protein
MIAIDRKGNEYIVGDIVQMKPTGDFLVKFSAIIGRQLKIVEIVECEHCESGSMLAVEIVDSGKKLTKKYDTNWFAKWN